MKVLGIYKEFRDDLTSTMRGPGSDAKAKSKGGVLEVWRTFVINLQKEHLVLPGTPIKAVQMLIRNLKKSYADLRSEYGRSGQGVPEEDKQEYFDVRNFHFLGGCSINFLWV